MKFVFQVITKKMSGDKSQLINIILSAYSTIRKDDHILILLDINKYHPYKGQLYSNFIGNTR